MQRRILIADDSEQTCKQLKQLLELEGTYLVDGVRDGAAALDALKRNSYSFLLTDLRMPGVDGMQLIENIRKVQLPVTIIVMTGYGTIDQAVKAIRAGAHDFLQKPVDIEHLRVVLERASRERQLQDEVVQLRQKVQQNNSFHDVVSKSPKMQSIFELVKNIADSPSTVLLVGETGTGKEMVARAIHQSSASQRGGAMVAVHCAALPETLLESELFGHEKGSFTGADRQRKGRFEMAQGGTLFLDEVGDIPASMQVKLLRVLQERRFERVGGTTPVEVDVRVVAATHRDLTRMVRKGTFREDLYYRLNVVQIELPPLRERLEDIPLLVDHFKTRYARPGIPMPIFSPTAMDRLLEHDWPGNIRELENAIERACVTARKPTIEPADLPLDVVVHRNEPIASLVNLRQLLPDLLKDVNAKLEKAYLRRALKKCQGNVGKVARMCGLSRRSISTKLAEYQLDKQEFKKG